MKVLYVDHSAEWGGATKALERILAGFPELDRVVVFGEDGPVVAELSRLGIPVQVLAGERPAWARDRRGFQSLIRMVVALRGLLRLTLALRRERPDVVHANTNAAALFAAPAARLMRIPLVWHVRDPLTEDYFGASYLAALRLSMRLAKGAVIANSEFTLGTVPLSRRLRRAVVHSAVAMSPTATAEREPSYVLRLVSVGRQIPWKGQDLAIRACASALGDQVDWELRLLGAPTAGNEEYATSLRALTTELGVSDRVVFAGHVDDVPAELARADIALHTSRLPEPFGQVVLQGLCAGIAVIASGAGGVLEMIDSGSNGLLFELDSVDDLARCIGELSADRALRLRLAAAGLRSVDRFRPEVLEAKILDVYAGVS